MKIQEEVEQYLWGVGVKKGIHAFIAYLISQKAVLLWLQNNGVQLDMSKLQIGLIGLGVSLYAMLHDWTKLKTGWKWLSVAIGIPLLLAAIPKNVSAAIEPITWQTVKSDFVKDTKEVFLKNIKTGVYYDFLENKFPDRYKFGVSTQLLAYRMFGVEPIFIYTPNKAEAIGEVGVAFPIRLGYIPISGGRYLNDLAPAPINGESGTILDKLNIGLYMSQNLTTGLFGFGLGVNILW